MAGNQGPTKFEDQQPLLTDEGAPQQPVSYPQYAPTGGYNPAGYAPQPPPYQPAAYPQGVAQQETQNVAVVMQQPAVVVAPRLQREPEYGLMALVFAIIVTVLFGFCLCWWSLPFTIVGIILGITSTVYGDQGDSERARTHCYVSTGCTIAGVVLTVIGVVVVIALYFGLYAHTASSYNSYNY